MRFDELISEFSTATDPLFEVSSKICMAVTVWSPGDSFHHLDLLILDAHRLRGECTRIREKFQHHRMEAHPVTECDRGLRAGLSGASSVR